jgi:hypothetical protein
VIDQNGNEWFPDSSVPIGIVTEAYYDPSNVYRWNNTVKATTATFVGDQDKQPLNIWARWQYRLNGNNNFTDGPRYGGLENMPIEIPGTIPEDTAQLKFFTAAQEQGDTPETQEYDASVLSVLDVIQPDVNITGISSSPFTLTSGVRTNLDVYATGNYEVIYAWQFEDPNGAFRNASPENMATHYPNALFALLSGLTTSRLSMTWVAGAGPTKWRCRVRDQYADDGWLQALSQELTATYV